MKTRILKLLLLISLGYLALNLGNYVIPLLGYLQWAGFSSNGEFPKLFLLPPQGCLGMLLRVHQGDPWIGSGLFTTRCFVVEGGFCCLAYVFGRTGYRAVLIPLLYLVAYPFFSVTTILDGGGATWVYVIEGIYFFTGLSGAMIFGYHSRFWLPDETLIRTSADET